MTQGGYKEKPWNPVIETLAACNYLLGLGGNDLLNVSNTLLEDLLKDLGVLELLLDLGDNGLSKLLLLALLNLSLVSDPRLKNSLGLSSQSSLLLKLESLRLKLGSLLGNLEQVLGDLNNAAHLLDVLNTALDSLGVVGTGAVEDVLDLVVLRLSPLLVGRATVLDQSSPDGKKGDGDDGLLVHDVVLAGDAVDGESGGGAEDGALAEEAVAGESVDDALSLLLGVLGGNIAVVSRSGNGDGRGSSAGEDGSEEGSADGASCQA
jgi:hypothetical protein